MERYTISQLAQAVDVPTTTLRYYERAGLLHPEDRSQGNYRLYSDDSLRRLKFIRAAQSIGFTLDDIKRLLGHNQGEPLACGDVETLIADRLAEIDSRLKDLRHVRRVLRAALETCRESERADCCPVLSTLQGRRE